MILDVPDGQQRGEDDHAGDDGHGIGQGWSFVIASQLFGVDRVHGAEGCQKAERAGLFQLDRQRKEEPNQKRQGASHRDAGGDCQSDFLDGFFVEVDVQIETQHEHGQKGIGGGCRLDQGEHELRKPNVQEGQDQEYGVDFDGYRTHDALEEAQEGELRRTGHEPAGQEIYPGT